jgi:hypothetical protein
MGKFAALLLPLLLVLLELKVTLSFFELGRSTSMSSSKSDMISLESNGLIQLRLKINSLEETRSTSGRVEWFLSITYPASVLCPMYFVYDDDPTNIRFLN